MREKMKKLGLSPPTVWQEKPIYISSTGTIIEQYVPPEGDGKASLVSAAGAKQVPYRRQLPKMSSKSVHFRHCC
jgi:large subunit ribosomal protein L45